MTPGRQILELVARWEELRERGATPTPEELCRDCPDCVEEVRRVIRDLEALEPPAEASTRPELPGGPPVPVQEFADQRYQPVRFHCSGGQGDLFVARDEELNREVVVKRVRDWCQNDPDVRRRFLREAEISGRLEHPGIVPVHGLGTDATGRRFYAMRLVRGDNLNEAIKRFHAASAAVAFDSLEFRRLLQRFIAICQTVAYAHSRGVIHRDIKPANIMLGRFGETLVIDWGLAKSVGRGAADRATDAEATLTPQATDGGETLAGHALGTPAYMSPEQARGEVARLGPTSDVYSLGATLYALLTGGPPFAGRGWTVVDRVLAGEFRPPRAVKPGVPAALEAVCLKAMAAEPAQRYTSALQLAADIERWLGDEPVSARPEPFAVRAWRWLRRRRAMMTGAAAALLVGAACLSVAMVLLTAAYERERSAKADAEDQRDRERAARRRAREALDAMTSRPILDWLVMQEGPAQKQFLSAATKAFESFAAEATDDDADRRLAANTHHRAGMFFWNLSQRDNALRHFEQAVALYEPFAADPKCRLELARSYNGVARMQFFLGQYPASEVAYRVAQDHYRRLIQDDQPARAYRHELSVSHNVLGALFSDWKRPADAEAEFRAALAIQEPFVREFPDVPEERYELACTNTNLGLLLAATNRPAEALSAHRTAESLFTRLTAEHPRRREFVRNQAATQDNLGQFLTVQGRLNEAERVLRAALATHRRLADDFPGIPGLRHDLAHAHQNLGHALRRLGRLGDAATILQTGLKIEEALCVQLPGDPEYAFECGNINNALGWIAIDRGEHAAAIGCFERTIDRLTPVVAAKGEYPPTRRCLADGFTGRAIALARAGRHADAIPVYDRAIALHEAPAADISRLARCVSLVHVGDHAAATEQADALCVKAPTNGGIAFNAACVFAVASAKVATDGPLAERHAARAVALLRQACAHGFNDYNNILRGADFAPLRPRADYLDLICDVAEGALARSP